MALAGAPMIPAGGVWAGVHGRPSGDGGLLGSRGSRSDSAAARPVPERAEPSPAPVSAPLAGPAPRPVGRVGPAGHVGWMRTLAGFAIGAMLGSSLVGGASHGLRGRDVGLVGLWFLGCGIVFVVAFLRHRQAALARPTRAAAAGTASSTLDTPSAPATPADPASGGSDLDRGVQDIRRMDPGFDPVRFAGYTGMMFREAQTAWTIRDIGVLRDRVTPEMYGALQAQCDRLRTTHRVHRAAQIEITEAWQESGRDYATACIGGSIVDYTVDDVSDALVAGSRTLPRAVEEFWTFTRPAGLNFWMLSAIQTSERGARP